MRAFRGVYIYFQDGVIGSNDVSIDPDGPWDFRNTIDRRNRRRSGRDSSLSPLDTSSRREVSSKVSLGFWAVSDGYGPAKSPFNDSCGPWRFRILSLVFESEAIWSRMPLDTSSIF